MSSSVAVPRPVIPARLLLRIGAMFSFETAIVAAYSPLLSLYMQQKLGLSPYEMALIYATGPLMALIAPLCAGFVADRLLPAERSLALVNLLRGAALFFAARAGSFQELMLAMAMVGFCSTPSTVLASSIMFHHLPDARGFGYARVWGVASWMVTVWAVSAFLAHFGHGAQTAQLAFGLELGALLAVGLGIYALTLPHTPPTGLGRGPLEAVAAVGLLRQRDLLALFVVAMATGAMFQMHMILQGLFFTSPSGLGLDAAAANSATTVAQVPELVLFPLLSLLLARFGLRTLLFVGVAAWPLRFAANAVGQPAALVVLVQLLHGFNVVFGMFAIQMAADRLAPLGRRASTQALMTTASAGFGALIGQLTCGALLGAFSGPGGTNWTAIYCVPLTLGLFASAVLYFGFRPSSAAPTPS
ncbi:MAG TPA: MFS transporter [Polyangiaceae bacterium]|nr:MFS transporter [Polyangiaceae bacterium]